MTSDDFVRERPLPVGDRLLDDRGHARVALELGDVDRIGVADARSRGLQTVERRELHVLLAERRQHLLDVAEEHRARPDEQHARRTPAGAGACRAGRRRGASATAVLPVPGPPATTSTPAMSARIASSCSAWIVATMSPMRPVRSRSSAARSAPSPATSRPGLARSPRWSNTSSSRPVTSRPFFVIRWRRRTTPIGATAVAR